LNPTATRRDLLVRRAAAALFKLVDTRAAKHRMSVRINKPGHQDLLACIDHRSIRVNQCFYKIRAPDFLDPSVAHKHSTIRNDAELAQLPSGAWARWSSKRHNLQTINYSESFTFVF
jgi:hypothetical protein